MNDTLKIKVINNIISDVFEYGSNDSANFLLGVLSAIDSVLSMKEDGEEK